MIFCDRTYSALVVSSSEKFNASFGALAANNAYYPITYVSNVACAKRKFLERSYDFVIVNAPLADDFGTDFAMDVCNSKNTVCLLLVKFELHEEIYSRVVEHGVYTLAKPLSAQRMEQALKWMAVSRERLRKLEKKTFSMEERMKEIRLVNRAKWLLIDNLKMTEGDAHRYIEKQAMDRCITRKEIAENIVKTYT